VSYTYTTLTSATPATDLMAALNTAIDAHAAWQFVETVTSGSWTADIFKCLGTVNSFGSDFYVFFARNSATGSVYVGAGEGWDATAKKIQRGCINTGTNAATPATGGSYATDRSPVTENDVVAGSNGMLFCSQLNLGVNTSGFEYWLIVTNDAIVVGTRVGGTSTFDYVGLYDSFHTTTLDPFPLAALRISNPQDSSQSAAQIGASSRVPNWPGGAITYGWNVCIAATPWTPTNPGMGSNDTTSKERISGKWWASRVLVRSGLTTIGANAYRGRDFPGLLKPFVLFLAMTEAIEQVGDTVTIDGVTYTCVWQTTNVASLWASQAA
jgi:hypothetical protein